MKKIKILGVILLIISIGVPTFVLLKSKITEELSIMYIDKIISNKDEYFAIIEIPKINLKKELFIDQENDVDKNVYVHPLSIFPNDENSNIILASHSGNGTHAYFKNLYLLEIDDLVNIYYNGYIYTYEIKKIEEQNKTGELYLIKNNEGDYLTLITCTKNNKNTQTIYYATLKNREEIT